MHDAGADAEPEIAGEERRALWIPDDLVVGAMARRENELEARGLGGGLGGRGDRPRRSPDDASIGANPGRCTKALAGDRVHEEGDSTRREELGVPGVILVIVGEHRGGDRTLVEESRKRAARAWKAAVDEDAVYEIRADVHAGDPASPAG